MELDGTKNTNWQNDYQVWTIWPLHPKFSIILSNALQNCETLSIASKKNCGLCQDQKDIEVLSDFVFYQFLVLNKQFQSKDVIFLVKSQIAISNSITPTEHYFPWVHPYLLYDNNFRYFVKLSEIIFHCFWISSFWRRIITKYSGVFRSLIPVLFW